MLKIPLGNSIFNQTNDIKKGNAGVLFKKDMLLAEI
jgi:hypothetical protein